MSTTTITIVAILTALLIFCAALITGCCVLAAKIDRDEEDYNRMTKMPKFYEKRSLTGQGAELLTHHIASMTAEGLDTIGDIAAELAWRDLQVANLKVMLADALNRLTESRAEVEALLHRVSKSDQDYEDAMHAVSRLEKTIEEIRG